MIAVVLLLAFVSLVAHESGHYIAGRTLGYRCRMRLRWLGPCTEIGVDLQPGDITGWRARVIALSGPAATCALLALALGLGSFWLFAIQLDMLLLASLRDYKHAIWVRHA